MFSSIHHFKNAALASTLILDSARTGGNVPRTRKIILLGE